MFGGSRRRHPPAQPLTRETANPNAATAAAAVFMSRRDSTSSLSSAAAAAALRARPMTPTNVAEVQSKRASRRSSSVNISSGSVGGRRPLTRTPSVGPMMERTFRTPSPGRSPAPREHVPPIPAIPSVDQILANSQTNRQIKGSKKVAVQTQPFRTASQKLKDGGRASWFAAATASDAKPRADREAIYSPTYVSESRPGSVSPSINFSYPRARALSPASSSSSLAEHTLVYDPNSRRMVPRSEFTNHFQDRDRHGVDDGAEKSRKKKKSTVLDKTGSHLSQGTVNGRTRAPVLDEVAEEDRALQFDPEPNTSPTLTRASSVVSAGDMTPPEHTVPKKKKSKSKKKKQQQSSASEQTGAVFADQTPMEKAAIVERPLLVKKPSVVKEEPQLEEAEVQKELAASGIAPGSSRTPQPINQTLENTAEKKNRRIRVQSESPARSAHFRKSSVDQLIVKHVPPARSVSPRKSAMKLGAYPRGVSPSDDGSEASGGRAFGHHDNDEAAPSRKKSVRVSWDDTSTIIVGEAAQPQDVESTAHSSPQAKKPWHSVVSKLGRKESITIAEDETMTPRPALPLFGSIREKKAKEPEERPLVRPHDHHTSTAAAAVGQSTDAMVGADLSQDLASRNAANISKYREPLAAVLPSIERKKDQRATAESSDDDFDTDATTDLEDGTEPTAVARSSQITDVGPVTSRPDMMKLSEADEVVPTISISHPSPCVATSSSDASLAGSSSTVQSIFWDKTRDDDDDDDDDDESDESELSTPIRPEEPVAAGASMANIEEEEEEEETPADRFSDAHETSGAIDGDGFLSLDAVVESPTIKEDGKNEIAESPEKEKANKEDSAQPGMGTTEKADMSCPDDWENAKAYWKSLTIDKRRQLEIEALSETGEVAGARKRPAHAGTVVTAPALSSERSYQIPPGTRWVEKDNTDDDDDDDDEELLERNADAIERSGRASSFATQATGVSSASKSKKRTSMRQSLRQDLPGPSPPADTSSERPRAIKKSMRTRAASNDSTARRRTADTSTPRSSSAYPTAAARQSLRAGKSNGDTLQSTPSSRRPASYQQPSTRGLATGHKHNMSSDDLTSLATSRPTLRRRGSDDSQSSFKRRRSVSVSADSRHFRTSMRSSLHETSSPLSPSKRFSLRSLSPTGSLPPGGASSSGGPGRMRQSLRDRTTSPESRFSIGSFKKRPAGIGLGRNSKRGSRFADSSDEEDNSTSLFHSRFSDSSDNEEPAPLPKSSGLPKSLRKGNSSTHNLRNHSVVSSDLSDDDDIVQQARRSGILPDHGTLEPLPQNDRSRPAARRGSIMSILRLKKGTSDKMPIETGETATGQIPARRPEDLAQLRSHSFHPSGPSWPLHDGEGTNAENGRPKSPSRPSTAGGTPAGSKRISFFGRRARADTDEPAPSIPAEHSEADKDSQQLQQAKKKKFSALRKIFGIHD
ncbi:hypothetical protein E4U13_006296 [Claviceps humidiphila]|uniref:Uncharacterized protein n=1 Tax=Claviceps humidiphila TaxID=1294629 RepID=A0A9P7Q6R9_9HYPO|nr:hypothetical protein E4U13_006296 [Claviceps humidiphila]